MKVPYQTLAMLMRRKGVLTPGDSRFVLLWSKYTDWNKEISEFFKPSLDKWRNRIITKVFKHLHKRLKSSIDGALQRITTEIDNA